MENNTVFKIAVTRAFQNRVTKEYELNDRFYLNVKVDMFTELENMFDRVLPHYDKVGEDFIVPDNCKINLVKSAFFDGDNGLVTLSMDTYYNEATPLDPTQIVIDKPEDITLILSRGYGMYTYPEDKGRFKH